MNLNITWLKSVSAVLFVLAALASLCANATEFRIDEEGGKFRLGVKLPNGGRGNVPTDLLQQFVQMTQMKSYKKIMGSLMKASGAADAMGVHESLATALARGSDDRQNLEYIKKNLEQFTQDPRGYMTKDNYSQVDYNEIQRMKDDCLQPIKGKASAEQLARISTFFDAIATVSSDTNCHIMGSKIQEKTGANLVHGEKARFASSQNCAVRIASNTSGMGTGEIKFELRRPVVLPTSGTAGIDDVHHRTISYDAHREKPISVGEWTLRLYAAIGKAGLCVNPKLEQPILANPHIQIASPIAK